MMRAAGTAKRARVKSSPKTSIPRSAKRSTIGRSRAPGSVVPMAGCRAHVAKQREHARGSTATSHARRVALVSGLTSECHWLCQCPCGLSRAGRVEGRE